MRRLALPGSLLGLPAVVSGARSPIAETSAPAGGARCRTRTCGVRPELVSRGPERLHNARSVPDRE